MTSLAIFAISRRGAYLAARLQRQLGGTVWIAERWRAQVGAPCIDIAPGGMREALARAFAGQRWLVLIMPLGAAVRLVAPLLTNKRTDPAIVVLDEAAVQAIALASGHAGGANQLAREVAAAVGARPIITTTADLLGLPALDLLGQEWGWSIEVASGLTCASAALLNGEPVGVYQEAGEEEWWQGAPANLQRYRSLDQLMTAAVAARLVISDRLLPFSDVPSLVLFRPRTLVIGIGCVRGATAEEIDELVRRVLAERSLARQSVREIATIDRKRDEAGLRLLAERYGWPIRFFSAQELAEVGAPSGPAAEVERAVGAPGVCEPAALRAAGATTLVVPKVKTGRVTVAVARAVATARAGRLTVVGLGPGAPEELTERARRVLQAADVVVGYHGYLDLIRPWLGPKAYHGSPIGEEVERCLLALDLARRGQHVALVSSGDAGIYGMAGPVFELLAAAGSATEVSTVDVVPGISAANAAAALLGAPLMSDYAVISLSDLLTPWEVIERRLEAAGAADLVIALYNPRSARRQEPLARAREILLGHRPGTTPVGLVRQATRPGQAVTVTDLEHLLDHPIDMHTVVIVGNRATIRIGDRLVTRRGYRAVPDASEDKPGSRTPTSSGNREERTER